MFLEEVGNWRRTRAVREGSGRKLRLRPNTEICLGSGRLSGGLESFPGMETNSNNSIIIVIITTAY